MNQLNKYRLFFVTLLGSVTFPFFVCATDIKTASPSVIVQAHPAGQPPVQYPQVVKKPVIHISYIPPKQANKGRPKTRVLPGGTRGTGGDSPIVTLLTPDEYPVFTARSQPVLYWHLSRASRYPVIVTLTTDDVEPLLEHVIAGGSKAGVHRLSLAEQGVKLLPGQIYEWSVCVQQDEDEFSANDPIARSFIQLSTQDQGLGRLANIQLNPLEKAATLARSGFWYDALEALMETSLEVESRALLKQVGLSFSLSHPIKSAD